MKFSADSAPDFPRPIIRPDQRAKIEALCALLHVGMRNTRFQEAMQRGVKLDKFIGYFFKGEPDAMRRSYHMVFTLIDGLNLPGIFIQANPHGEHGEMTIVIEFEGLEALGQIIASPVDEDTKRGGVTATLMRISSMFSKRAMDTANEVLSGATAPQVKALQGVNEMVQ